jgi:protein O-GlcNAc transferase
VSNVEIVLGALRREIEARPTDPEPCIKLGSALQALGRFDDAINAHAMAITRRPHDAAGYANLAGTMRAAGRLDEAIIVYREALIRAPFWAEVSSDLGATLRDAGRPQEARTELEQALRVDANCTGAHYNLALALFDLGELGQARDALNIAVQQRPDWGEAWYALGNILRELGEPKVAVAAYREAVRCAPGLAHAWSNLLFTLNFIPGETDETLARANRGWAETVERDIEPAPPPRNSRDTGRQLRIGYVSSEFRRHHFLTEFLPVLRAHDRNAVHVTCYADVARPDDDTTLVASLADSFRNLHGQSPAAQAAAIRADNIDVLISLTGYLASDRVLFARRIAPVQATYINHLTPTGLGTIDYRITDPWFDPPGAASAADTEQPIRLRSGYGIYAPPDNAPVPDAPPVLRNGFVTFGSFNALLKVTDETLHLWAGLMRFLPTARLLIKARELSQRAVLAAFQMRLRRAGIDADRCILIGHVADRGENLGHYLKADIALDPVPFTGGATTRELLWMGIPVVSLAGATRASRIGSSVLHRAGLGDLVATGPADYVRIAASLAGDPARLQGLRGGLRDRLKSSPLLDAATHTRELEAAYRQMWQAWCAQAPTA